MYIKSIVMIHDKLRTAILIVYLFLIAVIPPTAFVLSQNFHASSSAKSNKSYSQTVTKPLSLASPSSTDGSILAPSNPEDSSENIPNQSADPEVNFGPTLNFSIKIDGRPQNDQSTRLFIGIAQGSPTNNPSYLLSFSLDIPKDGTYKGLSMAGLTVGTTYTAYLKGKVQISSASAFLLRPAETDLNNNLPFKLITGDLNDDNVINISDYDIEKSHFNSTPTSDNWYPDGDFNKDNLINLLDLAIIQKNMEKVGNSGPWLSTPAANSGSLIPPPSVGSASADFDSGPGGYWMWIP